MIEVKILRGGARVPTQGSELAAGYDLYAALEPKIDSNELYIDAPMEIPPHETRMVPTGIAIAIPAGNWGGIYARSGLASKLGLRPANCVGVIDSDYRGEIFVALHNDTNEPQYIKNGDRIAQFIEHARHEIEWKVVNELTPTGRWDGGFGSTGK